MRITFRLLSLFALLALSGCGHVARLASGTHATAPRDNGAPAVVENASGVSTLPIPAGSVVESLPPTPEAPASVRVTLAAPSELRTTTTAERAQTGTIDTSVAKAKIAATERRWLLWAAIGAGLAGLVLRSILPAWPGLSNGLLMGAALAFAAWRAAEIPAWLWLVAVGVCAALALGYKRAEKDQPAAPLSR